MKEHEITTCNYHIDLECLFDIFIVENARRIDNTVDAMKFFVNLIECGAQSVLIADINLKIADACRRIITHQVAQELVRCGLDIDNSHILNAKNVYANERKRWRNYNNSLHLHHMTLAVKR